MLRFSLPIAFMVALTAPLAAQSPVRTLRSALEVLESIQSIPARGIPAAMLADAQGIAIIPGVIKAGFVVGGRAGRGVVFSRNPDGTWGEPAFVTLGGASFGFQAGVQSTDAVLVFRTRRSLERIVNGRNKITLGADVAIAAGPVGRQAAAGTDGMLRAEIFSYSRSRGLFAGVSLDGAALVYDNRANREFADIQSAQVRALVDQLRNLIAMAAGQPQNQLPTPAAAPILTPPPPQ